ncbi:MAG: YggS family pyridoxal phosphate-dependent enzyme [Bacteroidota bacterium]|nr:YggS family pyridoxal phosphate-dependent enzyme [Bacteroidota bacterium]NLT00469.1 YggS family pyridoxal phosphate-dependent enzyme [Bacteroidales bacterium]
MTIAENIQAITGTLPEGIRLVAVSKTRPVRDILEAYHAGQRIFGENKAREMAEKFPLLPADTEWHFVGHLQTNKVRMIAPFVAMIQSVDSLRLLKVINKEALACDRVIRCLLEFYIAEEETKFGLSEEEAVELLESPEYRQMKNIRICGVMGMATFTDETTVVRSEFRRLKTIFEKMKATFFKDDPEFREVSMGMSSDYLVAAEEGSTMVRIGSSLFGERISRKG